MFETNLVIYALSGIVGILALVLSTRVVKRRKNKPENIWAIMANSPVKKQYQALPPPPPPSMPIGPPPAHMFTHR